MDVVITDKKSNRTIIYDDVVSIKQTGKRLLITDANGWTAAIRVHDVAEVTIEDCVV